MRPLNLSRKIRAALAIMLPIALASSGLVPANADTAGSGVCAQTFTTSSGTGSVQVTQDGSNCFVAFKNTGNLNTQTTFSWTKPTGVSNVSVLVVGGGGGGGSRHGGGGGAGGLVETTGYSLAGVSTMTVVVGAGGAGAPGAAGNSYIGTRGQSSSFKNGSNGLTALGGGAGVNGTGNVDGGSGGGSGWNQAAGVVTSQAQQDVNGSTVNGITFGNSGASGAQDTNSGTDLNDYWAGGGGGGAGSAGAQPTSNGTQVTTYTTGTSSTARGGNGGTGRAITWLPTAVASSLSVGQASSGSVYFSGGGGGGMGADGVAGGTGGLGGGANGTKADSIGNNGLANTGGGGGGSGFDDIGTPAPGTTANPEGGDGGSGVVLLSYSVTPGAPTSVSTSNVTLNSVQVSFTAPTHAPETITGYQYSLNGGNTWLLASQTTSPLVITGLTSETTYVNTQIRAVSSTGGGASAAVSSFTTLKDPNAYLRMNFNSTDASVYDPSGASPLSITNSASVSPNATVVNRTNGSISLDATTRAWNFPGGTSTTGSYIDVGDISYSPYRTSGITLDLEVDFGNINDWERVFDFGEMRTSTLGEKNNFFVSRYWNTNEIAVGLWGDGAVISECRTTQTAITSGMHRWTIQLDGTNCKIWKNGGSQLQVARMDGSNAGSSISFGQLPNVSVTNNFIGKSNWTADAQFEGKIRSIRIYQGAFTPTELGDVTYKRVEFNRNGGSSDPSAVSTSGKIRVPALGSVTRIGYTLDGWTDGANVYAPGALFTAPTGTTTLNAVWLGNLNSVTWDSNGGTAISGTTFRTGQTIARPSDPTKTNVVFGGWSTTETSNQGDLANRVSSWPYASPATSGITLYAIWLTACSPATSSFVATGTSDPTSATYGTSGRTYTQVRFNAIGSCGWVVPDGATAADIMIVGGGGAGSYFGIAGGGGAGAVLVSSTAVTLSPGAQHIVEVGTGGIYTYMSDQNSANTGTKGSQSRFSDFIAPGGGNGAGGKNGSGAEAPATVGGSGGGGSGCTAYTGAAAGSNPNYSGFSYFANAGATASGSFVNCYSIPGGGGGAGGAATNANGGASLTRFGIEVAGGGAAFYGSAVGGGNVGGDWVTDCVSGTNQAQRNGATSTGSGGSSCGSGGSGTVVIRYSSDFTVTLAAGTNGSGSTQTLTKQQGGSVQLPGYTSANSGYSRTGYVVGGWSTNSSGSTKNYEFGGSYSADASVTLYPFWQEELFVYENFDNASATLTNNTGGANSKGFSDRWTHVSTVKTGTSVVQGTSLPLPYLGTSSREQYPLGVGLNVETSTSPKALTHPSGGAEAQISRPLTNQISMASSQTLYMSFLVNDSTAQWDAQHMFGFMTGLPGNTSDNTGRSLLFGFVHSAGPQGQYGIDYGPANVMAYCSEASTPNCGATKASPSYSAVSTLSGGWTGNTDGYSNMVLVKIVTAIGSNDNFYLKVFKPTDRVPSTDSGIVWDATYSADLSDNFQRLTYQGSATSYATMDEVRLGTTYNAAVAPVACCNVTFVPSGAIGTALYMPKQYIPASTSTELRANLFSRTGGTFDKWTTQSDGTGTSYLNRQSISISQDITLYSQWVTSSYTISYAAGANGTGTTQTVTKSHGVNITLANSATANSWFTRANYTVTGWATTDGGAQTSALGSSFATNSNTVLYPVWTLNSYSVTFASNYAGGADPVIQSVQHGVSTSLTANSFTRAGHTFAGWTQNSDGTGTSYTNSQSVAFTSSQTLYAKWDINTYTITLAAGANGTGSSQLLTKTYSQTLVLPSSTSANAMFTRSGYFVSGWTTADGSTESHALGGNFTTDAATTLYPVWALSSFVITLKAGTGGSGSDRTITKSPSVSATLPSSTLANSYFTYSNKKITGWSLAADGSTLDYELGASYTPDVNVTLYPVWSSGCTTTTAQRFVDGIPYNIVYVQNTGTCTWNIPAGITSIEALVVGGGGGGGGAYDNAGAGGGAGGQAKISGTLDVTGMSHISIRVGAGGTGGTANRLVSPFDNQGNGGGTSEVFLDLLSRVTALGGDGGSPSRRDYLSRTSGTGGAAATSNTQARGGAHGGGGGIGGGGGGATGAGTFRGAGGAGLVTGFEGITATYGTGAAGGTGGTVSTSHAVANSGNGGRGAGSGSSSNQNGSNGGSGLVVIRYAAVAMTVTYNYNGATGGNSTTTSPYISGSAAITLPVPTKTNSVFDGWFVSPTFAGTKLGSTYSPSADVTLYAKWAEVRNAPSAPVSVSAVSGPASLVVSWAPPARAAGNVVTGYQLEYSTNGTEWTIVSSTISSTARSFTISNVVVGTSYYTRVAAQFTGGLGAYGYPWTKIYETTTRARESDLITYTSGFGLTGGAATANSSSPFTRIRYRMEATYGGSQNYADVDFLRTLSTTATYSETYDSISKLQVPTTAGAGSQFEINANIADLSIESNVSGVENGYGLTGRVEIWPWNYGVAPSTGFSERVANTYDDADTPGMDGVYGSFQVHRIGSVTNQTVLAWNRHFEGLAAAEIGFGDYSGANSDWTFCTNVSGCGSRTNFLWQAFINKPTQVLALKTVTFNANFGSTPATTSQAVTSGTATSLSANTFTRSGYVFVNWTTNANGTGSSYSNSGTITTANDLTLYAQWRDSVFTVTYNKNGASGAAERASESYTLGATAITLPLVGTMAKTGYVFGGWSTTQDDATTKINGTYTPTQSVTLYALWTAGQYSYSYNLNGATSGAPSTTSGTYTTGGTAITLATQSTMVRTGYAFNGWSTTANDANTKVLNSGSYTISAPVILYALWNANNYSVSYSVTGADTGTAPSDSSNYNISQSAVVKANTGNLAKAGYSFAGWTINSDGSGTVYQSGSSYTFGASNVTFYPKFTANTYTITYNTNGGTGTPAGGSTTSYTTGTSGISLANVGTMTKTGYDFAGWSTNPTGSAHSGGFTTTADVTLYAIWTLKDISVTYARGVVGGTALSSNEIATFPVNATGKYGATITISGTVSSTITVGGNNYQFFGWSDGNSTYRSGDTYLLTDVAPTFTAQWVRLYAVRYALNGGTGIVTVDSECQGVDYTCLPNAVITLSNAPSRDGYQFTGWKDQSNNSYAAGDSFTVTDSKYLLYAQWQAVNYTMAFDEAGGSNSPADLTKNIGQSFSLPNPGTKTGYDFAGWSDGSVTYGVGVTYNVGVGNVTFTAIWTPKTYLVTYNWNGGSLASGSAVVTFSYTVGNAAVTLASGSNYTRDGYIFDGWSLTNGGAKITGTFTPTGPDMLYARWIDGAFEINYNAKGGSVSRARDNVTRSASVNLPTPTRSGFTFGGWYEDSGLTRKIADGGASHQPHASRTMYAKWTQNSLVGINPAHLNTLSTTTVTGAHTWSGDHALSGTGAALNIPSGALDAGTVVNVSFVDDLTRPKSLIDNDFAYYTSVVVHWLKGSGDSATVPNTAAGKEITLTLTNPNIKVGSKVFMIVNGVATEVATATQDGQVTVSMSEDPEFVIAATKPDAPTNVSAMGGNTQATVSWTAAGSGGSAITGYTVTASGGGGTCTTTGATSCVVNGLTNGVAYTFTVTATNAIGTSVASSASASVTPALVTYTVTFDSNGGTSVSTGTFASGGTVSAPTAPTKQNFNFAGWSTILNDATTAVNFPYAPGVTQNITLYALWTAVTSGNSGGSSSGGGSSGGNSSGSGPTAPEPVEKPQIATVSEVVLPANTVRQIALPGENLDLVKWVKVDGKLVSLLRKKDKQLVMKLPRLAAGKYSLEINYGGSITTKSFLNIQPEPLEKVNAGSFNGYVAIFARGYEGQRLSAKIGDEWLTLDKIPADFSRITSKTGIGVELNIKIYVNRKLVETVYLLTH